MIPPKKIRNITEIIEKSSFAKIAEQSLQINRLNQLIQQVVPEHFKGKFRVIQCKDDMLYIEVGTALIKQAIQLQKRTLLSQIQTIRPEISQLMIRINPDY